MEALNITQLPRWKQDEIMIDGLTRRVQQLLEDADAKNRKQAEAAEQWNNEKKALVAENVATKKSLVSSERKVARLMSRKKELRAGIHVITQQRETLTEQRHLLQGELLDTRAVRDGLLTDRTALMGVLTGGYVLIARVTLGKY